MTDSQGPERQVDQRYELTTQVLATSQATATTANCLETSHTQPGREIQVVIFTVLSQICSECVAKNMVHIGLEMVGLYFRCQSVARAVLPLEIVSLNCFFVNKKIYPQLVSC